MSLLESASLILTPNGYKSGKLYSIVPSSGNGDFTFTRATSASRTNSSGLIENVLTGVPRLDYSGSTPSILLEPQRTNLLRYSNEFNNGVYSNTQTTLTSNFAISPDGTQNAYRATSTGTDPIIQQEITSNLGRTYNLSVYAKGIGNTIGKTCKFFLIRDSYAENTSANFTLTSEWKRFDATLTLLTQPTTNAYWRVDLPDSSAVSGDQVLLYGAQLESGSYATSYIPTVASTVTRNVDVISKTGISTLIGQTEGTLYTEVAPMTTNPDSVTPILYILSADSTNRLMLYLNDNGGTLIYVLQIVKDGSAAYESDLIPITNTNFTKLALRYKVGEISLWKDGVKTFTYTDPTYTAFPFASQFEQYVTVGGYGPSVIGTKLKGLQFYKTALTDAQCIALTTL